MRSSACVTLGIVSPKSIVKNFPKLLKAIKDGSISRDVVCSTIMHIDGGYQELIGVAERYSNDQQVLKAVIKAFRRAVQNQASIDPVLSFVLKHTR